ncbi:unnamed protein product [Oikopleura dioica]|uniref:PABS domain-containing protein n=1 Tax=Oikopleura dioica TaxID=34765 RepID=E4Y5H3_OIKDI|nr:unnamed protein product [Oikopleura dioica]
MIKSVLVDFNCEKPCGETIELFSNSAAFVDLGLTLQTWNVKEIAGTVLYTGSDGVSLLIQWYPGAAGKLFATVSGPARVEQIASLLKKELEANKATSTVFTPPLKRGLEWNPYIQNCDGTVVENDFQELLFHQKSPFQDVKIFRSNNFGSYLLLDDDPNLADSDLAYTKAICGSETFDFSGKNVFILGGGDGGIINYLRNLSPTKPKYIEMIDIDEMVMNACAKHMRATCGDSLDQFKGENYEIFAEDCVPRLTRYGEEGKKFDFIISDLTAIPVDASDSKENADQWAFMKLILNKCMLLLTDEGIYTTQGHAFCSQHGIEEYRTILDSLNVHVSSEAVSVPSYHEKWVFYTLRKKSE